MHSVKHCILTQTHSLCSQSFSLAFASTRRFPFLWSDSSSKNDVNLCTKALIQKLLSSPIDNLQHFDPNLKRLHTLYMLDIPPECFIISQF